MTKLLVKNLKKNFGTKKVLKGIDLQVKQGESLVILGGSGSGKSVLIKIISNLLQSSSGTVAIDGQDVSKLNGKERDALMEKFGFLFQGGALFDSLPIWENVAFRLINHNKMNRKEAREVAISKLKSVGLSAKTADPIMADVINDLIIDNSKKLGATTVTITHDMNSARKIADKIAMLHEGKIIWFGDVKDMYSSGNEYLDQFIHGRAEGPINFLAK